MPHGNLDRSRGTIERKLIVPYLDFLASERFDDLGPTKQSGLFERGLAHRI